ncbi:MAG TPA: hypothetical protein VN641_05075 [Urbifossiella sp.]|nr:hypothetical protein [Urbifossiella sp.]
MPSASILLAGALAIAPKPPVQLHVDFAGANADRIEIKLFDTAGSQVGISQTIELANPADVVVLRELFKDAMEDFDLTCELPDNSTKATIAGPPGHFGRLEYTTYSLRGKKWVKNPKLKGPTVRVKPKGRFPSLAVNPKPL